MDDYDAFENAFIENDVVADKAPGAPSTPQCQPRANKAEQNAPDGSPTQYATVGDHYRFVPNTVPRLPSGVYIPAVLGNDEIVLMRKQLVTDNILRLPDTRSDELISEIENFWKLKQEFRDGNSQAHGGYMHKRGYFIFGPPGGGKTSTVNLIIQSIVQKGGIVVLGGNNPYTLKTALHSFRLIEPDRNVLVTLEDFDSLIEFNGEAQYLAMLDGDASIDGSLFLATTNYPHKFDPRIYNRPGRFSDVVFIDMPTAAARRIYLQTKLKDTTQIDFIIENTAGFSLDHLKSLILGVYFEKRPLDAEIKRLKKLFLSPKLNSTQKIGIGE